MNTKFVIQQHKCLEQVHWDLMLQKGDCLATWQIPDPPQQWPQTTITCQKIADHRLKYLTCQGQLTENRGEVRIVAAGQYKPLQITEKYWHVTLQSDNINGTLQLKQIRQKQWHLLFQGELL